MTTLEAELPVWAILAPLDVPDLAERALVAFRDSHGPTPDYAPAWKIQQKASGSALMSFEVGSEGVDETIAEALSADIPCRFFLLRFTEDNEVGWIYEGGRRVADSGKSPAEIAGDFGILGPAVVDEGQAAHVANPSLCFLPGTTRESAARHLGFESPPTSGPLHIVETATGCVVYSDSGSAASFFSHLSEQAGGRAMLLSSHQGGAAFSCWVVQDGEDVGIYEYPRRTSDYAPPLDDIAGEIEPTRILTMLGIPAELLGIVAPDSGR